MPEKENDVKITDKRKFDKDGNIKEKQSETEKKKKLESAAKTPEDKQPKEAKKSEQTDDTEKKASKSDESMPPIEFIPFIISLYSSVLATLGEITDPSMGKIEKNPAQAKELIDIIKMLREKTKGNLSEDEQNVIDEIIYQSEMIYVKNVSGLML